MMVSIIGNFSSADTPLVGSSSNKSLGERVKAIAMSSSLRTPPGNSATRRLRCSLKAKRSNKVSARSTAWARRAERQKLKCPSWQALATSMLSMTDKSPKSCGI
jgi:hypothetical protein